MYSKLKTASKNFKKTQEEQEVRRLVTHEKFLKNQAKFAEQAKSVNAMMKKFTQSKSQ